MENFNLRVDIIRQNIGLSDISPSFSKRAGSINCPFCFKKNKGYLINNSYFKCFSSSCGVKGDVISIYQKLHSLNSYGTALYLLEISNGINPCFRSSRYQERNEILSKVLDIYSIELSKHPQVLNYLYSRGFTSLTIDSLPLGYAPFDTYNLSKYDDLNISLLTKHKLINEKQKAFFINRIIFPIRNETGALIHLSGRWFGPSSFTDFPKYKDTQNIPYIGGSKHYLLFEDNLSNYLNRTDTIILTEGIPDSIILNQLGLPVLGLLGLEGLTSHRKKLKEFKNIIAIFDTDKFDNEHPHFPNEFKSWIRIIPQLVDLQCTLPTTNFYIYTVPVGKDINDFYLQNPSVNMLEHIENNKQELVSYLVKEWGPILSKHPFLLKLIASTNKCKDELAKYIPSRYSPLDYALSVLNE